MTGMRLGVFLCHNVARALDARLTAQCTVQLASMHTAHMYRYHTHVVPLPPCALWLIGLPTFDKK
jgi:hypothetical protein